MAADQPRLRRDSVTKVVVPGAHDMVSLLGQRDELLRDHREGVRVRHPRARQRDHHHRRPGRERARGAAVRGARGAARARRRAQPATASSAAWPCCAAAVTGASGRRADAQHPVQPRPHDPPEDAEPEALRRRHRRAHDRLRHRPGGHRQDLPGDGQGRAGAAGQAGQPHHPDPPGGRGGRAARLPARHALREDRPVPAPALRRAARHGRPGVDPAADGERAPSRSRRWRTCAAAPSTTRSSSSTRRRTPRPSR